MKDYTVKVTLNAKKFLKHYNGKDLDLRTVEDLENYIGTRPYGEADIPLLLEYHLLGDDLLDGIKAQ
jgi:hypothetical protein